LDAVFGFRSNHSYKPLGWSVATFDFDDTISLSERTFQIPSLGRSGREIRTTYLLRGVEPSQSIRGWNWGVRQLGLHHVFDVETGRALWISIKGNKGFRESVEESLQEGRSDTASPLHPSNLCDSVESFPASMEFHHMAIDWCDANWRWYISDLEDRLRQVIEKASTVTIDQIPLSESLPKDVKQTYMRPPATTAPGLIPLAQEKGISRQKTLFSKLASPRRSFIPVFDHREQNESRNDPLANKRAEQQLISLDICTVRDQQELQILSEKVQEGLIVVRDNSVIIRQLKEEYLIVVQRPKFPCQLHSRAQESVSRFAKAVEGIEERMSRRTSQLEQLATLAENGRSLVSVQNEVSERTEQLTTFIDSLPLYNNNKCFG